MKTALKIYKDLCEYGDLGDDVQTVVSQARKENKKYFEFNCKIYMVPPLELEDCLALPTGISLWDIKKDLDI